MKRRTSQFRMACPAGPSFIKRVGFSGHGGPHGRSQPKADLCAWRSKASKADTGRFPEVRGRGERTLA